MKPCYCKYLIYLLGFSCFQFCSTSFISWLWLGVTLKNSNQEESRYIQLILWKNIHTMAQILHLRSFQKWLSTENVQSIHHLQKKTCKKIEVINFFPFQNNVNVFFIAFVLSMVNTCFFWFYPYSRQFYRVFNFERLVFLWKYAYKMLNWIWKFYLTSNPTKIDSEYILFTSFRV